MCKIPSTVHSNTNLGGRTGDECIDDTVAFKGVCRGEVCVQILLMFSWISGLKIHTYFTDKQKIIIPQ